MQNCFLHRCESVQTRLQYSGQSGGNLGGGQTRSFDSPSFSLGHDDFAVNEHFDEFFDVKGIALGAANNQFAQGLRDFRGFAQNGFQQRAAVAPGQRFEVQPRMSRQTFTPGGSPVEQSGPRQTEDHQWSSLASARQMTDQIQRPVVA